MIPRQLLISKNHLNEMFAYVESQTPLEACGLLAGKSERVEKVILVRNQAQSAVRFVMDAYEQLRAFEWIDSHGLDLLGIFHSHPAGPETVSATDITEAAYEVVHVICSKPDGKWAARGFWIENRQPFEIPLLLADQ
jgi:proteasome lid subunit RPN8/RPN11